MNKFVAVLSIFRKIWDFFCASFILTLKFKNLLHLMKFQRLENSLINFGTWNLNFKWTSLCDGVAKSSRFNSRLLFASIKRLAAKSWSFIAYVCMHNMPDTSLIITFTLWIMILNPPFFIKSIAVTVEFVIIWTPCT